VPTLIHRAARVFRGHPAIGYLVAFVSVALATALQWWASDFYQGAPFLTIYPAVVITAFVGGYPAGLLSAVLAGLSQWYFFIPQYHWLAVLSYVVDAVVCVLLIEYVNRSLEKETEAKQHEALLRGELQHRFQNLLAVSQAVIHFSLPSNDARVSAAAIKDGLLDRLQAMVNANRHVSDAKGEVALIDLIHDQMRGFDNRYTVHGRPLVMLNPQLTQNFSLILHELVTNSLKYGALSNADGSIQIKLMEVPSGVLFDWAESGGPSVKAPPADGSGDGFGSRLLGPFARSFCVDVAIAYEPTGLHYSLQLPRQELVEK
jgi:two-component sensor histidine kinase